MRVSPGGSRQPESRRVARQLPIKDFTAMSLGFVQA